MPAKPGSVGAEPTVSQVVCPLCGKANQCGMATGATSCWCFSATVPASLIEQLPEALRGAACICRDCVRAHADREGAEPTSARS